MIPMIFIFLQKNLKGDKGIKVIWFKVIKVIMWYKGINTFKTLKISIFFNLYLLFTQNYDR